MCVQDFNEFSNHAPISFSLKINTEWSSNTNPIYKKVYKWDDTMKNDFVNNLQQDCHLLQDFLITNVDVDENVRFFSNFLKERANHYFEKNVKIKQDCKFQCSNSKLRQAWYDQECREKKANGTRGIETI